MKFFRNSSLFIVGLALFTFVACSDDDSDEVPELESDVAADEVGSIVSGDIGGIATRLDEVVKDAESQTDGRAEALQCGIALEKSFPFSFSGPRRTVSYELSFNYELNCNSGDPINIGIGYSSTGEFDGPQLNVKGSSEGDLEATGFGTAVEAYIMSGNFTVTASSTRKLTGRTLSSETSVTSTDLEIRKSDGRILSGTSQISAIVLDNGENYRYTATVAYNGDDTATITISGNNYTLNISTGVVTENG